MNEKDLEVLWKATLETLYMTIWSLLFIIALGFLVGLILYYSDRQKGKFYKTLYTMLSTVVSLLRAMPFAIIIVLFYPLTRILVGTGIGSVAIIPALVISCFPFFSRTVESALKNVDQGLIEAGISMGVSELGILIKIVVQEALPALIQAISLTAISVLGYVSLAGIVGGGGLGYVAIQYGLYRNNMKLAYYATGLMVLFVLLIQGSGSILSKKLNRKR